MTHTNLSPSVINKTSGRRCRICKGRPLKSECPCTLNPDGTRRVKRRISKPKEPDQTNNPDSVPLPGLAPPQTWSSPGRLTITIPALQNAGISRQSANMESPSIPTAVNAEPLLRSDLDSCLAHSNQIIDPLLNLRDAARPVEAIQSAMPPTPPSSSPAPSSPVTSEFENPPLKSLVETMNASFTRGVTQSMDGGSDPFDEPNSDLGSPPSTPSHAGYMGATRTSASFPFSSPEYRAARKNWEELSPTRKRAPRTAKQALYGLVSGSMQGSLPLKIKRQKPLRRVMVDGVEAARRFSLEMKFVIDRAERVALETGSWVFIAGQQPQARTNFIHFSSNTMRTHALEETQQLTNQFSTLISDLREARLGSALSAQRTLRATQTAFEDFQAQVKQTLEEKDCHTEYLVSMVDALRQQIGVPGGSSILPTE